MVFQRPLWPFYLYQWIFWTSVCKLTQINEKIIKFENIVLWTSNLAIEKKLSFYNFWAFLRSTELKALRFESKLHVFPIKTVSTQNSANSISVVVGSCQKLAINIENNGFENWNCQEMPIRKKRAPKKTVFNEKRI